MEQAGGGGAQSSVAVDEPLMTIGLVEPELISVAEPVTVESPVRLQFPDAVSVAVLLVAVNVMVPGNVVDVPSEVTVKWYLIVYVVPAVKSPA